MSKRRIFIAEFNRPRGDNIRRVERRLNKAGISAQLIPHKTTIRLIWPTGMSWVAFVAVLKSVVAPRIGSMILFSKATGNAFLYSNRGNVRSLQRI